MCDVICKEYERMSRRLNRIRGRAPDDREKLELLNRMRACRWGCPYGL